MRALTTDEYQVNEKVERYETSSPALAAASLASLASLAALRDGSTRMRWRIDATSAQLRTDGKKSAPQKGASIFSVSWTTLTFCDTLSSESFKHQDKDVLGKNSRISSIDRGEWAGYWRQSRGLRSGIIEWKRIQFHSPSNHGRWMNRNWQAMELDPGQETSSIEGYMHVWMDAYMDG